jgi:CheY-like chemotaxis protein
MPLAGRSAVVVVDDEDEARIVSGMLEHWGMRVSPIVRSTDGERPLPERRPDVDVAVVRAHTTDDGQQLAAWLRCSSSRPTPIVWITSDVSLSSEPGTTAVRQPVRTRRLQSAVLQALSQSAPLVADAREAAGSAVEASTVRSVSADADAYDPSPGRALRILLAEDNAINQRVTVLMLGNLGYQADIASDGRQALDAFERHTYDLLFLDLQMPEVDGFEVARQLRDRMSPDVKPWIVALTATAMAEDRQACMEVGMDDFLSKPIRQPILRAALDRARDGLRARRGTTSDRDDLGRTAVGF